MNESKCNEIIASIKDLKSQQGKIISSLNNQNDKFNKLFNKFEELLKTVSTLSEDNKILKGKVEVLEKKIEFFECNKTLSTSTTSEQDIISELIDRQIRANNIIVFNLPESNNSDHSQSSDKTQINNIFNKVLNANVSVVSCSRMGKINTNSTEKLRPVKVVLQNSSEVFNILRLQVNLRTSSEWGYIRCASDRTLKQQEHMTSLRNELQRRRNNNENNLTIKYIKGIPTIINTSKNL